MDFPKSERIRVGLKPLLGESVFISNGALWARQRRIIDPAFEGGRIRRIFPAMWDCGVAAVERLKPLADGRAVEIKAQTSHVAMDVIFRALFSVSIDDKIANAAFEAFGGRKIMPGSQVILSPWHLHRHERLWDRPDAFDPTRFETPNGKACLHTAYIPFSVGPARLSRFGFCHGQRGLAAVNAGAGLPL